MNVKSYHRKNQRRLIIGRIKHPWPLYRRRGGISAVVIRANGDREDLGVIGVTYQKQWGVGSGQ